MAIVGFSFGAKAIKTEWSVSCVVIPSIFVKGLLQTVEEPFLLPAGHLAEVIYHAILGTHKTGSEGGGGKDEG